MTTPIATATIRFERVEILRAALDKLSRRALRLGVAPYEFEVGAPYVRTRPVRTFRDEYGMEQFLDAPREVIDELVDVTVRGEPIKLAGWTPLARIDFLAEEGGAELPVLLKFPGVTEDLMAYAAERKRCDHCKVRRVRSVVYLLRHEDGRTLVVGSSCLADFLGHKSPEAMLALVADVARAINEESDEDGWDSGGSGPNALDLVAYLSYVAAVIREFGWTSRAAAREDVSIPPKIASADLAWYLATDAKLRAKLKVDALRCDRAVALLAARWAKRLEAKSDYETNVLAIGRAGYVVPRVLGIAASIVSVWLRNRERARAASLVKPDAWSGELGKRGTFSVFVLRLKTIQGERFGFYDSGLKTLVTMVDVDTGALMVWFCSGSLPEAMVEGAQLAIKGTVKKHDTYKGTKQTVLSRVVRHVELPKKSRGKKAATKEEAA